MRTINRAAPIDELTSIPWPIYSVEEGPVDTHHIWYPRWLYKPYGRRDKPTEYQMGVASLLLSCTHEVSQKDQKRYHAQFEGVLPPSPDKLLLALVLSLVKYVPPRGIIVMRGDRTEFVRTDDGYRQYLWERDLVRVDDGRPAKNFLTMIAMRYGMNQVGEDVIEDFLDTHDGVRRQKCASRLLRCAGAAVVDSLEPLFKIVKEEGSLPPSMAEENEGIGNFVGKFISPDERLTHHHLLQTMRYHAQVALAAKAA